MAVGLPGYFDDAEHGRVTKTFSDPTGSGSSYNAVSLPFIRGQQPALGGQHKAPHFVSAAPEPSPQAAHLPRHQGFGCDLESRQPPDHDGDKWDSKQLPGGAISLFILPDVNKRLTAQYITLDPITQSLVFSEN